MFSNRWVLVSLAIAATAYGCAAKDDDKDDDGGGGGTGANSSAGTSTDNGGETTAAGGAGATANGGTKAAEGGDGATPSEGGAAPTSAGSPISSCSSAVLFEGNPQYDGELEGWTPEGQGRFDDPPLRSLGITSVGQNVYFDTNFEVWTLKGDNVVRIAGDETAQSQYQPSGACADVRLINIQGLTTLPNGNVVIADPDGGGLIELDDPTGDCTASAIAGNQAAILESEIEDDVANQGDVEGDGAKAKFYGIKVITADEEGNIYGDDQGNGKIKKIANDAKRTVSTLYDYPGADAPFLEAMTAFGGKLYVAVGTVTDDLMWAIDTTTGAKKDLYKGRGIFDEVESSQTANISGLTNDGEALIATSNKGYIWRINTAGKPAPALAGMGAIVDYPEDIDWTKPVPVAELPLKGFAVNRSAITMLGQHILWGGRGNGLGFHVVDISCK